MISPNGLTRSFGVASGASSAIDSASRLVNTITLSKRRHVLPRVGRARPHPLVLARHGGCPGGGVRVRDGVVRGEEEVEAPGRGKGVDDPLQSRVREQNRAPGPPAEAPAACRAPPPAPASG